MTSPKTVTPDQPQAVPDALTAIQRVQEWVRNSRAALLTTDPDFMPKHVTLKDVGAFLRQEAANLAARPVLPVETPAEGLREAVELTLRDATYHLSRYRPHVLRVLQDALTSTAPAPLSGRDGSLREALERAVDDLILVQTPTNHGASDEAHLEWVRSAAADAERRARAALTCPSGRAFAAIDVTSLHERHITELRDHADKLRWQMENDERPTPPHGWTCFHCAQIFTTWASASAHFGDDPLKGRPECWLEESDEILDLCRAYDDGFEALADSYGPDALPSALEAVQSLIKARAALAAVPPETAEMEGDTGSFDSADDFEEMCDALDIKPDAEHWKILCEMEISARKAAEAKVERAAEDERDRLYEKAMSLNDHEAGLFLNHVGAMLCADRLAARASSSGEAGDETRR